ncbi:hypothetical protein CAPTEDRAFT_216052 [Capitella teleta]|uniref:Apple domain-containing protein n=1 Tax=Capitella teleta TaxID=283909 RepID=R7TZY9_CAPTE|nr:hypothetical protein CAPTEDRAFT_216052 [Capitella teleta]|eukprot:ELT96515.1 hypothetical protein CAPTEDRAFT_216052 [Capitella teleta]
MGSSLRRCTIALLASIIVTIECVTTRNELLTIRGGKGAELNYPAQATEFADHYLDCYSMCASKPCCLVAIYDELELTCAMYDIVLNDEEVMVDNEGSMLIERQWDQAIVHHIWAVPIQGMKVLHGNVYVRNVDSMEECRELCEATPEVLSLEQRSDGRCNCQRRIHTALPKLFVNDPNFVYEYRVCGL